MKAIRSAQFVTRGSRTQRNMAPSPIHQQPDDLDESVSLSMIEFGIQIKLPGLDQFKPAYSTPFDNIIDN